MLFRWRQEMHVSYQDMMVTPYEVVVRDMEYLRLTNKAIEHHQQQQQA